MNNQNVFLNFLKSNACFIRAYNFYSPYADMCAISVLPVTLEMALQVAAETNNVDMNKGITRDKQVYYTTPNGLVILSDCIFTDDMVYSIKGYTMIYPEATMQFIWNGILRLNESQFIIDARKVNPKLVAGVLKEIADNEEKTKSAMIKAEVEKNRFFSFIMDGGGSELLAERLWGFDVFYSYSDDINVFRRGSEKEKILMDELAKCNIDGIAAMAKLVKAKGV